MQKYKWAFICILLVMAAAASLSEAAVQTTLDSDNHNSGTLPARVSLYDDYVRFRLPAQNQNVDSQTDTCWDYAVIGALELELSRAKNDTVRLSGHYMAWAADQADRTTPDHQGSNFGRATRALEEYGVCPLDLCPPAAASVTQPAVDASLVLGSGIVVDWLRFWKRNKPGEVLSDEDLLRVKQRLASGHPVAVGMRWPIRLKPDSPQHLIGEYDDAEVQDGHCVTIAGYEDNPNYPGGGAFIIRNTWGTGWQDHGFARMSYNYFRRFTNDMVAFRISSHDIAATRPTTKEVTNSAPISVHKMTVSECTSTETGLLVLDSLRRYKTGVWLNDSHLFFAAVHSGSEFSFKLNVAQDGDYALKIAGTRAPDFGIYSFTVGSTKLGSPIDFSAVSVRPTGPISVSTMHCSRGEVTCTVRCEGKAPFSSNYRVGIDWVSLEPVPPDH